MSDSFARILALKANKSASEANERLDNLPKGVNYKGSVNYFNDLPTNAENGDMYTVKYKGTTGTTPDEREFVWGEYEGTLQWNELGAQGDTLNVEDNVLIASAGTMESIEMNPTLSGTEQALTGIKVGDGPAYKIEDKLVEITFRVSTYNEIKAIVDGGKLPYFVNSSRYYRLTMTTSTYYEFTWRRDNVFDTYRVNNNNSWETRYSNKELEVTSNKETTLTPSSTTYYPSSKAVADYVAQHSGGGEMTLLWTNASPTSQFREQTITLNMTSFKGIMIEYLRHSYASNNNICKTNILMFDVDGEKTIKDTSILIKAYSTTNQLYKEYFKDTTLSSNKLGVQFSNTMCYTVDLVSSGDKITSETVNDNLIPYRIYGFN